MNGEVKMIFKILAVFILLVTSNLAYAQEQEEKILTYNDAVEKLHQHPMLESVRQQVIEQQETANGAGGLPDPMMMFGINNYPADGSGGFDRFAMTSKSIGFTQKIPNSGVRSASALAKKQLSLKAKVAESYTQNQLVAALNRALVERERVIQQENLVRQDINLLKQEAAYWDGRLQAGDSALDERSRVDAELAQSEAKLATLKAERVQFSAELHRLIGTDKVSSVVDVDPLPWPNILEIFPVLLAQKDVHVARANVAGAESAFDPNYQLGVTYAQRDNTGSFDGGDFVSAQVGVSIPLWANKNQKPKLRAAQASVRRAEALLEDARSKWHQSLATQFAKIKETQATKRALKEKERSIQTQISSLRGSYESNGRLDTLIAAKRNLLKLKIQLAELDAKYVQQVSFYNAAFKKSDELEAQKEGNLS